MQTPSTILTISLAIALSSALGAAQEAPPKAKPPAAEDTSPSALGNARKKAGDVADDIAQRIDETAQKVDEDSRAHEISAGILNPIYRLAEYFSFASFHWLAFALMVSGVVGFAGQLVLGKLVLLSKHHFSLMEIIVDALGLAISVVGLVLTTQAAAENSDFTNSPFAVLSATGGGCVVGLIMYLRGQSQEILAARAAKQEEKKS